MNTSNEPTGTNNALVVPLRRPRDLSRVAPTVIKFANAMNLSVEVLSFVHPDDDFEREQGALSDASLLMRDKVDNEVSCVAVKTEDAVEAFFDYCADRLTCMPTSATPFRDEHYVGSFAAGLLARSTKPVILIGPSVEADTPLDWDEVVVALSPDSESMDILPVAREVADAMHLSLSKVHIDSGTGNVYENEYGSRMWFPGEIHATVGVESMTAEAVGQTIVERAAGELLAVKTHAREGLAWIADGSIAFDAIGQSLGPVLLVGPNIAL